MADALKGAGAKEAAQERRLEATALAAGRGALSSTTVTAAQVIIKRLQANDGNGSVGEPASDLRQLRTNSALLTSLGNDFKAAKAQANELLYQALLLGYSEGLVNRSMPLETANLKFTIDITAQDKADLVDYPVMGFTAMETAEMLILRLNEDVNRMLAAPLTSEIEPATIPQSLAKASESHAQRLSSSVGESYAAGIQAAVRAIKNALVGK